MIRSRLTLATIEAAAIDSERPSPPTSARPGQGNPGGTRLPSISAAPGAGSNAPIARRMARSVARKMVRVSMSSTEAMPTPTEAAARMA